MKKGLTWDSGHRDVKYSNSNRLEEVQQSRSVEGLANHRIENWKHRLCLEDECMRKLEKKKKKQGQVAEALSA